MFELGIWEMKKLASGSLDEALLVAPGVLGAAVGGVVSRMSNVEAGALATMTWLNVVKMYISLLAWGSDLAQ